MQVKKKLNLKNLQYVTPWHHHFIPKHTTNLHGNSLSLLIFVVLCIITISLVTHCGKGSDSNLNSFCAVPYLLQTWH